MVSHDYLTVSDGDPARLASNSAVVSGMEEVFVHLGEWLRGLDRNVSDSSFLWLELMNIYSLLVLWIIFFLLFEDLDLDLYKGWCRLLVDGVFLQVEAFIVDWQERSDCLGDELVTKIGVGLPSFVRLYGDALV